MKIALTFPRVLALSLMACGVSYGTDILDVTSAITTSDSTQLGRISRNGVISDWSAAKPFPGIINPATTYYYATYTVNTSYLPYLQITFDDIGGTAATFVSAYQTSYDPTDLSANYLGDEGSSGNYFGTDPRTFQVYGAPNSTVQIVVNTSSAAGLDSAYELLVQSYADTNFTDTPEPASFGLAVAGMIAAGVMIRRKRAA